MKRFNLLLIACLFIFSATKCSAKDDYYYYKAVDTKVSAVNANVKRTITNKNYKVIANDNHGDFYFIPVQMTFWDGFYYGKARIRGNHYFAISTKQSGNDSYLVLSKNYAAAKRKQLVLWGINDSSVKLKRAKELPELKAQAENFKARTQEARKQTAQELEGGSL